MATRQLSSTIGAFLNPPAAVYTRDHISENRRARKALEADAVARRLAAEAAAAVVPLPPTHGKFKHVPSRLAEAGVRGVGGRGAWSRGRVGEWAELLQWRTRLPPLLGGTAG